MKKIIVCIDFTEGTDQIIEKSIELAVATNAGLCLIHVALPEPEPHTQEVVCGRRAFPDLVKRLYKCNRNRHFDDYAKRIKNSGIELTTIKAKGEAAKIIVNEAIRHNAEMIIMGAKNNSALHHLIIGSVTADVMKKIKIPVVLIPVI